MASRPFPLDHGQPCHHDTKVTTPSESTDPNGHSDVEEISSLPPLESKNEDEVGEVDPAGGRGHAPDLVHGEFGVEEAATNQEMETAETGGAREADRPTAGSNPLMENTIESCVWKTKLLLETVRQLKANKRKIPGLQQPEQTRYESLQRDMLLLIQELQQFIGTLEQLDKAEADRTKEMERLREELDRAVREKSSIGETLDRVLVESERQRGKLEDLRRTLKDVEVERQWDREEWQLARSSVEEREEKRTKELDVAQDKVLRYARLTRAFSKRVLKMERDFSIVVRFYNPCGIDEANSNVGISPNDPSIVVLTDGKDQNRRGRPPPQRPPQVQAMSQKDAETKKASPRPIQAAGTGTRSQAAVSQSRGRANKSASPAPAGEPRNDKSASPAPGPRIEFKDFSHVYPPSATNADVWDGLQAVIYALVDGQLPSVAVIANGQSGSGKSFTMFTEPDSMLPLASSLLFQELTERELHYEVKLSVAEIQGTVMYDLSFPGRSNKVGGGSKPKSEACPDSNSLVEAVRQANRLRHVRGTTMNERSSRSHLVVEIEVTHGRVDTKSSFSLMLADLAGSEKDPKDTKEDEALTQERTDINSERFELQAYLRYRAKTQQGQKSFYNRPTTRLGKALHPFLSAASKIVMLCCVRMADEGQPQVQIFAKQDLQFADGLLNPPPDVVPRD